MENILHGEFVVDPATGIAKRCPFSPTMFLCGTQCALMGHDLEDRYVTCGNTSGHIVAYTKETQ
jgi:hypothetical protein